MKRLYCGKSLLKLLVCLVGLTGCTNAKLAPSKGSVESASAGDEFYLATPKEQKGPRRFIFFVDMSNSMVSGGCKTDVDNDKEPADPKEFDVVQATTPGLPCASDKGVDPNADRLAIVEKWLNELDGQADTKVILMPFTGGIMETNRLAASYGGGLFGAGAKPEIGGFTEVRDAKEILTRLKTQHKTDLEIATKGVGDTKFMGTSTPATFLSRLSQFVYSDMKDLQDKGQLTTASYRMFFFSDGVATPTLSQVKTALNLKKCSHTCLQKENNTKTCSKECRDYFQEILDYWGNPEDNSFANIKQKMTALTMLPEILGEGSFQLNLITVHPERIEESEKAIETNYLANFKKNLLGAKSLSIQSSIPPFSLAGANADVVSYKLTALYALNNNFRLNPYGDVEADSDGDGLFDSEELQFSKDPRKQRTSGVCLDSIAVQPAYKDRCATPPEILGCNKNWDTDGDGLNECEEMILGTSPSDFDSDGDLIPDGLEVVYRNYLGRDDGYLDTNSDNVNNHVNFMAGLMPHHYIDKVRASDKVSFSKQFLGFKSDRQINGQLIQTEGYRIQVLGIPIGTVLGTSEDVALYYGKVSKPENKIPESQQILFGPKTSNSNSIIFLARIIDVNDTSKAIWAMLRKPIVAEKGFTSFGLDLSKMQTLQVRDPIKAIEAVKTNGRPL